MCQRYKPCGFPGFVWTDCWGNIYYYVITSLANVLGELFWRISLLACRIMLAKDSFLSYYQNSHIQQACKHAPGHQYWLAHWYQWGNQPQYRPGVGGGHSTFFQVGVCGPDFRSVGLANWHLPLKREACERKISKFGGLWAENFQIWGFVS